MEAEELFRVMRLAHHELRTPVTHMVGVIRFLRRGDFGSLDGRVDAVLAALQPHAERLGKLAGALHAFGNAHTVVGTIDACVPFVRRLRVIASDEARIVAVPADGFGVYVLALLRSLFGENDDALTATAEVLVTPQRCRVLLGAGEWPPRKEWRRDEVKSRSRVREPELAASVTALEKAGCTVTFFEHRSGAGLIQVRWERLPKVPS